MIIFYAVAGKLEAPRRVRPESLMPGDPEKLAPESDATRLTVEIKRGPLCPQEELSWKRCPT